MDKERKYFDTKIEIRAGEGEDKNMYVEGYALKFNTSSRDFGGFTETISERALDDLKLDDVMARFEHSNIIGHTRSNTLQLEKRSDGLYYKIALPNTTAGNDLKELVARGDVNGSSFAFDKTKTKVSVRKTENGFERTIEKMGPIIDVGPVSYPAYVDTSAGLRDVENFKKELKDKKSEDEKEKDDKSKKETVSQRHGLTVDQELRLAKFNN